MTANSSRCSIRPQLQTATEPPGRTTRAASARAATKSAANWSALTAVATSKRSSSHGNSSIGPTRRSAPGTRRRAISIMPSAASMPATSEPRAAASAHSSPLPQPTSSTRMPGPIPVTSASTSRAGSANAPHCSAQPSARALHSGPSVPAVDAT